jgi:CspA family cold shock protein
MVNVIAPVPGNARTARVKWFSPFKGFGFVQVDGSDRDVFVHVSIVTNAGLQGLKDGATIQCDIGPGNRGDEVKALYSVDDSTAVESAPGGSPRERNGFGGDRPDRGGFKPRRNNFGGGDFGGGDRGGDKTPVGEKTGTVKWFNGKKGFGFISPSDGGKDIFIHFSVLRRSGLQSLDEGQEVRVKVVNGNKGQEADSVELV